MQGAQTEFEGTDRFEVLSRLGAGGVGVVYEALDHETNQRVALKILRTKNAEMLLRFKEEFRAVQTVRHPNLVSLGELGETMGTWFFTMELVDGVNFIRWVREGLRGADGSLVGPLPFREDRLRSALAQLAQALMALHRAQKVHRDIKPSNIMVARDGRAVLLDFGFIADQIKSGHTTDGIVVGTADYMAPEQAAGRAVGAAADWYAVGVVLYRALTGRLPYSGSRVEVLLRKQQVAPVPPAELISAVPADLAALCMELLRIDIDRRATGEAILSGLGESALVPSELTAPADEDPFVGRQSELAQLHDAYVQARRGRSVTVYLTGESGVGKSALLHRFASSVVEGDSRAFVLVGRCHERESVPYKGIDGVVDELSRALRHVDHHEAAAVLPLHVSSLAQIFPVMRRVEAVAQSPPPMQDVLDPVEQRRRVFAAMRELLARVAERRPLVVVIEDLQWVDADSLLLLKDVMQAPDEPPLLLIASARTDQGLGARKALATVPRFLDADARADTRHLHLEGLPKTEARELAALLLRRAGGRAVGAADAIADEASGHPLFIDELVQHSSVTGEQDVSLPSLDSALWARIAKLGDRARRILEMVSLAGAPVSQECAAEAAGLDFGEFSDEVALLRNGKLTRTTGTARADDIEPYHGRVRDAVLEHLSEHALVECHRRLALALEATGAADLQSLAIHWHGAGDLQKAGAYAEDAAQQAAGALAFDRAARLYREAIEWRPVEGAFGRRLRRQLGDALANAGRGAEAAQAYLEATEGSSAAAQLELTRLAADQLLRSGFIDEGLDALDRVMGATGMELGKSAWRTSVSHWLGKARLRSRGLRFKERDASQVSLEELTHIDIHWSASIGLASVDYIRGADYQTRHLLLALDAGEPYRICRALMTEVSYSAATGELGRTRTKRLVSLARDIADRIDNDHARGLVSLAGGIGGTLEGQWGRALVACEASEAIFRDYCTNVWWERTSGYVYSNWCLAMLGRLADLGGRSRPRLREAEERGDLYASTNLRTGIVNLAHLAEDNPDVARAEAEDAIRPWSRTGFTTQHAYDLLAQAQIDLYEGQAVPARDRIAQAWPHLKASRLLRVQLLHVQLLYLRARVALAVAAAGDRSVAKEALKDAKAMVTARAGWGEPLAALIRAGEAALGKDDNTAHRELERAADGFDAREMSVFAAVTRRHLGTLLGGQTGEAMVAGSDQLMRRERVKDPARFAALLAPGFDS